MKAVIYARYSSDSQREESIEGQIRECTAFAEKNGIIDRIQFPEGIREHIFWERIMHEPGYEICNQRMDLIGLFFMQFSSREEMLEMLIMF